MFSFYFVPSPLSLSLSFSFFLSVFFYDVQQSKRASSWIVSAWVSKYIIKYNLILIHLFFIFFILFYFFLIFQIYIFLFIFLFVLWNLILFVYNIQTHNRVREAKDNRKSNNNIKYNINCWNSEKLHVRDKKMSYQIFVIIFNIHVLYMRTFIMRVVLKFLCWLLLE